MVVHIGTSGWSYSHWDGVLYPIRTPPSKRLAIYADRFDTVELNASFYRWPLDSTFASWRLRLPVGFVMSVKAPRGLTHARRLYAPEAWLARIASGWKQLGNRQGVLLVQLGPGQVRDDARLDYFLSCLPAAVPVTMEFRHPSWHVDPVFRILERHQAGYCAMSGANLPCVLRATASFVYIRLHGPDSNCLYGGSYRPEDLFWWAERIREWQGSERDVFVYFNKRRRRARRTQRPNVGRPTRSLASSGTEAHD